MTVGKGKRPRDPNQLAKWLVDSLTSEASPSPPLPSAPSLSAYMAAIRECRSGAARISCFSTTSRQFSNRDG